ncbi:MAG: hypothetical protein IT385_06230 [Deltaproteobacteria bacterium]|nr:hypothetical protein [Deltaproteobacteria bacterium]
MAIVRAVLVSGLVAVAFLGVPGARAADPPPAAGTTDDEDELIAGGGACTGGGVEGVVPLVFGIAGLALRRRAR